MSIEELEALAATLVKDLQSVQARIPDFLAPHETRPKLTGIPANIPNVAIEHAFSACIEAPFLGNAVNLAEVATDHHYTRIFSELRFAAAELDAGLDYTMRSKRYRVGQATLHIFHIASRLVKSPEHAKLRTAVEGMAKVLKQRRRRAKAAKEPETA